MFAGAFRARIFEGLEMGNQGAELSCVASCRRVVVRLSGSWPYLEYYRQVSRAVAGLG